MQGEEFRTTSDIQSLIMNWESKLEVGKRSTNAQQMEDVDGRSGRRRSQIFLDLCSKFEGDSIGSETEIADKSVRDALQSKDLPNFGGKSENLQTSEISTCSSLRANWDTYVPRKINWKQQEIKISHNGFSLVTLPANHKRGGSEDKVSAGKSLKQC